MQSFLAGAHRRSPFIGVVNFGWWRSPFPFVAVVYRNFGQPWKQCRIGSNHRADLAAKGVGVAATLFLFAAGGRTANFLLTAPSSAKSAARGVRSMPVADASLTQTPNL